MSQIRRNTVQLVQGQALVRHVWQALFTAVTSGPFVAGQPVTWGTGGGTGTIIRYDASRKELFFVRTAGAAPLIGNVVASGATSATIVEMGEGDPPAFDAVLPAPLTQVVILAVSGAIAPYFMAAAPNHDNFTLSAPWAPESIDEASYGLQKDFTPWGLPIIEPGDTGAPVLVSYGLALIEARAGKYVHVSLTASTTVVTGGQPIPWDRVIVDPDGWFQVGGALRVPAGVSLIEVEFNAWTSGGTAWGFWLTKNGTPPEGSPYISKTGTAGADGHNFKSGPIPVVTGDLIRVICGTTATLRGGITNGKYTYVKISPRK